MKRKPVFKSKTVKAILTAAVIVLLNLLGVGEEQIGKTYDTINDHRGRQTETAKDIGLIGTLAWAFYGRMKADTKLGKGANDED